MGALRNPRMHGPDESGVSDETEEIRRGEGADWSGAALLWCGWSGGVPLLEDVRDTATADGYAAFECAGADGQKQTVTHTGSIGFHPEERLWSALRGSGVEPSQVV